MVPKAKTLPSQMIPGPLRNGSEQSNGPLMSAPTSRILDPLRRQRSRLGRSAGLRRTRHTTSACTGRSLQATQKPHSTQGKASLLLRQESMKSAPPPRGAREAADRAYTVNPLAGNGQPWARCQSRTGALQHRLGWWRARSVHRAASRRTSINATARRWIDGITAGFKLRGRERSEGHVRASAQQTELKPTRRSLRPLPERFARSETAIRSS